MRFDNIFCFGMVQIDMLSFSHNKSFVTFLYIQRDFSMYIISLSCKLLAHIVYSLASASLESACRGTGKKLHFSEAALSPICIWLLNSPMTASYMPICRAYLNGDCTRAVFHCSWFSAFINSEAFAKKRRKNYPMHTSETFPAVDWTRPGANFLE